MVAPARMITPDKIGITMAKNRGLPSDVVSNEGEAIAWLVSELSANGVINGPVG